jgi:hypothetical protein
LFPTEAGGKPEQLTSEKTPSGILGWSADGASLFIWRESESGTPPEPAFYVLDLKTRQASRLPDSEGLHDGLVSPNGKYVAALNEDDKSVVLYDLHTHQPSELARGVGLFYVWWAHDGKAVFFQDILEGSDTPIYRVEIDNHRMERVTNFAQPFADARNRLPAYRRYSRQSGTGDADPQQLGSLCAGRRVSVSLGAVARGRHIPLQRICHAPHENRSTQNPSSIHTLLSHVVAWKARYLCLLCPGPYRVSRKRNHPFFVLAEYALRAVL